MNRFLGQSIVFLTMIQLFFNPQNAQLKTRIFRGYLIPIFLLFFVAVLIFFLGVRPVTKQADSIERINLELDKVQNIAYSILAMQREAWGYLIVQAPSQLETYEYWDTQFYEQSEILRDLIQDQQQKTSLNKIIQLGDDVNEFSRRLISYVELGRPEKVREVWNQQTGQKMTQDLDQLVKEFEAIQQEKLTQARNQQTVILRLLTVIVFLSTGMGILIVIFLALGMSKTIAKETGEIAASSSEIATTLEQQERAISVQAASLQETTTTLAELNTSVQQSSEQAQSVAVQAREALDLSEQGYVAVEYTLQQMEDVQQKVNSLNKQNLELREKLTQINTIASLVSQLATQTNMLALNASMEAVRAGEQGRGFGIVAQEIRRLAEQSKRSAESINTLITDIKNAIEKAVLFANEGDKKVKNSVESAHKMAKTLVVVTQAFHNINDNNQIISLTATQQAQALQQTTEAMNIINRTAQENAQGIAQVQASTQRLNQALQRLT